MTEHAPHYHAIPSPIPFLRKLERTKTGAQVFRFLRLTLVGVAAFFVSHNGVTAVGVVGAAEVAFRQVFPPSH